MPTAAHCGCTFAADGATLTRCAEHERRRLKRMRYRHRKAAEREGWERVFQAAPRLAREGRE